MNHRGNGRTLVSAVLLGAVFVPIYSASAEDYCNGAADRMEVAQHGWYWNWENDLAATIASDKYYTQGAQIGYTFESNPQDPGWMARLASPLCKLLGFKANSDEGRTALGAATMFFGQQLFTPRDTDTIEPISDERPYAGWIYVGARQELVQPLNPSEHRASMGHRRWLTHLFELQVGKTGKTAIGEETQRAAHDLDGSPQSNGWNNQMSDHTGWQAYYRLSGRAYSFEIGDCCNGVIGDVVLHGLGAVGNMQQFAEAGGVFRLGRNLGVTPQRAVLPTAFTGSMHPLTPPEKPNLDLATCDIALLLRPRECYVFIGVSGRGVVKNVFVESVKSGGGSEIEADEFVYELTMGFRLRYKWASFDYVSTTRSREFEPAPANPLDGDGRHSFGSFTMSCYGEFGGNNGKWQFVCPGFVAAVAAFLVVQDNKN